MNGTLGVLSSAPSFHMIYFQQFQNGEYYSQREIGERLDCE